MWMAYLKVEKDEQKIGDERDQLDDVEGGELLLHVVVKGDEKNDDIRGDDKEGKGDKKIDEGERGHFDPTIFKREKLVAVGKKEEKDS